MTTAVAFTTKHRRAKNIAPARSSDDTVFLHIPLAAAMVTPLVGGSPPLRIHLLPPENNRALMIRAHVVGKIVRVPDT